MILRESKIIPFGMTDGRGMWKGKEWRQCALNPHRSGPELMRLRKQKERQRDLFFPTPSGGGVQPSPSKAEQLQGLGRDAGVGEGVGQALVPGTPSLLLHQAARKCVEFLVNGA